MIRNGAVVERQNGGTSASRQSGSNHQPVRHGPEMIAARKIESGRKTFFLDLIENHRGKALRITEDVGGRRDTIMVPAEIVSEMATAMLALLVRKEAQ